MFMTQLPCDDVMKPESFAISISCVAFEHFSKYIKISTCERNVQSDRSLFTTLYNRYYTKLETAFF